MREIDVLLCLVTASFLLWLTIILLPWHPWSTKEHIEAGSVSITSLNDITVLIPARNEGAMLRKTLPALTDQGNGLRIVVIDDSSEDDTFQAAKEVLEASKDRIHGTVLKAPTRPKGWSGKLWALEQGLERVNTSLVLLLDADILLKKGILTTALHHLRKDNLDMLSLMATLRMECTIERLFMPAFVYFFKLLYPFALVNKRDSFVAGAAGGFILVKTELLKNIGAFASLRDALIDDCTLARMLKQRGASIYLALSRDVISERAYNRLADIWQMVSRTAYTQLHYNPLLLLLVTFIMLIAFPLPIFGMASPETVVCILSFSSVIMMAVSYMPVLRYYELNPVLAFTLPAVGAVYLLMTWSSALNHYLGNGPMWKGRTYT